MARAGGGASSSSSATGRGPTSTDQHHAALLSARAQVSSVRDTVTRDLVERLLCEPNPSWPEMLDTFQVLSRQLSELAGSVDPVLQFFSFVPQKPTQNLMDIPLFLSTQPLSDMAEASRHASSTGATSREEGEEFLSSSSPEEANSSADMMEVTEEQEAATGAAGRGAEEWVVDEEAVESHNEAIEQLEAFFRSFHKEVAAPLPRD